MRTKISFIKSLLYCGFACKKDKQLLIREKAMARLERPLDIRSFVSMHTNLTLLIKLIFTEQQAILFQHHRARAISTNPIGKGGDESSAEEAQKPVLSLEINGNRHETFKKLYSHLFGHSELSRMDKQLLIGIFGNKNSRANGKDESRTFQDQT